MHIFPHSHIRSRWLLHELLVLTTRKCNSPSKLHLFQPLPRREIVLITLQTRGFRSRPNRPGVVVLLFRTTPNMRHTRCPPTNHPLLKLHAEKHRRKSKPEANTLLVRCNFVANQGYVWWANTNVRQMLRTKYVLYYLKCERWIVERRKIVGGGVALQNRAGWVDVAVSSRCLSNSKLYIKRNMVVF